MERVTADVKQEKKSSIAGHSKGSIFGCLVGWFFFSLLVFTLYLIIQKGCCSACLRMDGHGLIYTEIDNMWLPYEEQICIIQIQ